jgi:hypothetical protein
MGHANSSKDCDNPPRANLYPGDNFAEKSHGSKDSESPGSPEANLRHHRAARFVVFRGGANSINADRQRSPKDMCQEETVLCSVHTSYIQINRIRRHFTIGRCSLKNRHKNAEGRMHIALEMAPEWAGSIVQFRVLSADDRLHQSKTGSRGLSSAGQASSRRHRPPS